MIQLRHSVTKVLEKKFAILRIKSFNPENIFLQHIPVKEKVEVNRMKINTTNTLTSVNIQEIVENIGKVTEIRSNNIFFFL